MERNPPPGQSVKSKRQSKMFSVLLFQNSLHILILIFQLCSAAVMERKSLRVGRQSPKGDRLDLGRQLKMVIATILDWTLRRLASFKIKHCAGGTFWIINIRSTSQNVKVEHHYSEGKDFRLNFMAKMSDFSFHLSEERQVWHHKTLALAKGLEIEECGNMGENMGNMSLHKSGKWQRARNFWRKYDFPFQPTSSYPAKKLKKKVCKPWI